VNQDKFYCEEMGGGISKDGGKMHYKVHNIYLNFVNSYGRLNPTVPVTIHQKALFLFWISCLIIFLAFCVMALLQKLMNANIKCKDIHANGDDAENKSDIFLEKSSKRPGTHLLKERSPATEILLDEANETPARSVIQKLLMFFRATHTDQPTFSAFITKMCMFGAIMFYFWLTDFVHLW